MRTEAEMKSKLSTLQEDLWGVDQRAKDLRKSIDIINKEIEIYKTGYKAQAERFLMVLRKEENSIGLSQEVHYLLNGLRSGKNGKDLIFKLHNIQIAIKLCGDVIVLESIRGKYMPTSGWALGSGIYNDLTIVMDQKINDIKWTLKNFNISQ